MTENKPFCISKWAVLAAWQSVRANQGAAGVDGVSIQAFEKRLKNNLYRIWNRMSSGSYLPPPVKRVMIHCRSREEALAVKASVEARLRRCRLEAHPEKTRLVYCRDSNRPEDHEHIQFDFLGYCFRPRLAKGRRGKFTSFIPAISPKASKALVAEVRRWELQRMNRYELADLSRMFNSKIRGWVNYYGRFYPSQLRRVLRSLNLRLARWAQKKYKRLRPHVGRAIRWLQHLARGQPSWFAHWEFGAVP